MIFSGYEEFVLIALFTGVYYAARRWFGSPLMRNLLLLGGNAVVVNTLIGWSAMGALTLWVMGVWGVSTLVKITGIKRWGKWAIGLTLTFSILFFSFRSYEVLAHLITDAGYSKLWAGMSLVQRVGLSYVLFRILHFTVDVARGRIPSHNPLLFLNYIFFFPSFLSGPIDRFQNFHFWFQKGFRKYDHVLFFAGVGRIFLGAVKKLIVVPLIFEYATDYTVLQELTGSYAGGLFLSLIAYSFYIYADFSGYSDIAIGMAYTLGIKTAENFDSPYLSLDIRDFWQRWHMSFSSILGEYIFRPFVKGLSKLMPFLPRYPVSVVGYLYTFLICGLWHGTTLNFVWWGLWHGVGLAIFRAWANWGPSGMSKGLAMAITFIFVTIGWFFFHYTPEKMEDLFDNWPGQVEEQAHIPPAQETTITAFYR